MGCTGNHCNNYYTPCKSVGSLCGGHDGSYNDYSCTGHTVKRQDNTGNFHTYDDPDTGSKRPYTTGDVVSSPDINMLRAEILKELSARKVHPLYSSLKSQPVVSEVKAGTTIEHSQQNSLAAAVKAIATLANANSRYGDNSLGVKNTNPYAVSKEDLLSAKSDLVSLEKDLDSSLDRIDSELTAIIQDCICHTDCTLYNQGGKFVCSCYGYCCHYGWW